ncbi:MAG: hypothetical protein R6U04_04555 [Bacteroidales bacterium]
MQTIKTFTGIIIAMLLIAIGITSCSDNSSSKIDLTENQQQKEVAFSQIMENEQLFNEFMDRMMDETESMHWMMENQQFMNHMFMDENLDYIMNHNEGMDQHMMQSMGNVINRDSSMSRQWDHMMQEGEHMH